MNLQHDRIQQTCAALKLDRLAIEWGSIADRSVAGGTTLTDFLEQLLNVEIGAPTGRSRDTLLKFAGFSVRNLLEDYDFKFARGAPRKQLNELSGLAFIELARMWCFSDRVA